MDRTAVKVDGVSHVYVSERGASLAVDNISFLLRPGEFVSLVGPSGCGKTTLLSVIAGLIKPTMGQAEVFGVPVERPTTQIGYMLQQDYLFPWLSIERNVLLGLELTGKLTPESRAYTLKLLDEMKLGETRESFPAQLSGGMRQRAALVRTLSASPDVLLLDEPFSALDYQTKLQLEDLVALTLKVHNKTALLVTHDLSEAIAMSDRILVLGRNPGRLRKEFAVPTAIRRASPFRAREQEGFNALFREIWRELEWPDDPKGGTYGA